jgi:hypothetical protein
MRQLDCLDLAADDVRRIDEIISLETGTSLAVETASWRRRRNWLWAALLLGMLALGAAGAVVVRWWA